jgi:dihydrofolate reductase
MRRLIMWNLMTLDGCFEGVRSWDLDWHQYAWGPELEAHILQQLRVADRLLFGRVTYQGMADYWTKAKGESEVATFMNSLPKVVFSRSLDRAAWNNTELVKDDACDAVARLKGSGNGEMYVFGSGRLSRSLIERGLFDEYRLLLTPVLLGAGAPLFGPLPQRMRLRLLESRVINAGPVLLRYAPFDNG